jgi:hypothetical protein
LILEAGQDLRELFIQEVLDHLDAIGRRGRTVCFIEPKYAGDGPVEQEPLAQYYRERHGLNMVHADPKELCLKGGEVYYQDDLVDIGYRDYEIGDLLYLEAEEGLDISPLRALFKQNRIVSSVAGEFDHKSCWEVLTDPQFTQKYFTADERQIFRRHVLWTRVIANRRTTLPDGATGDLLEYARCEQETLVIKPNRSYGGDRVIIGPAVSPDEWHTELQAAVTATEKGEEQFVVQQLARIPVSEFPVVGPDGAISVEPYYTVVGLAPTKYGVSLLGRASQKMVVNVAQRGGLFSVLVGKPGGRLMGPGAPSRIG